MSLQKLIAGLVNVPAGGAATTSASDLTSGTLADARLSSNIPKKNAACVFVGPLTVGTSFYAADDGDVYLGNQSQLVFHSNDSTFRYGNYDGTVNYVMLNADLHSFFIQGFIASGNHKMLFVDSDKITIGDMESAGSGANIVVDAHTGEGVTVNLPANGKLAINNLATSAGATGELYVDGSGFLKVS